MHSSAVIAQARSWIGVPFLHQGRNRHGVDCAGLFVALLRDLDLIPLGFKDSSTYSRSPSVDLREIVVAYCTRLEAPEAAAIALIRWPADKVPSHLGLLTPENIIHSYERAGAVIETGYRAQWPRLTDSLWRMPGVEP